MNTSRVRSLRKNLTEAEQKLWLRLRRRQIAGHKFRRQQPIGAYIVDFACLEQHLIIELDGGQHAEQSVYDEKRTNWLESRGYRVLRFWNNEVMSNTDGVLQAIMKSL